MEWISVEERLPKDGIKVRVKRDLVLGETIASHGVYWWLSTTTGESGSAAKLGITHWAPLTPEEPGPDGWISVEEMLPEEGPSVLVGWAGRANNMLAFRYKGLWGNSQEIPCFEGAIEPPTHWQPLPDPPKEPEPLPRFYMQPGSWLCPIHTVYRRGYGRIIALADQTKAQILCDKLNHAWDLDLDKGSNEEHHDTATATDIPPTDGRATRSPCCTDGGTCNRSV